jgi:hypothetical protein
MIYLVASSTTAEHHHHLSAVFSLLQENGLVVNADKCLFGYSSMDFLGHRIGLIEISPLSSRVRAIADFPQPSTV